MKIGISIPNNWGVMNARALVDLAVLAEDCGFASVWTSEHLINTAYVRSRIGDRPYYHPLALLSAIAGCTRRITLGTSVIVLPFHNPFDIAKYAATLDQISGGRLVLGIGVGNVQEEFAALNIPWEKRGALTDESIAVMQALWSQQAAAHEGKVWKFEDIHTSPKPVAGGHLPLWIGGMSDAALRRTARVADGWLPTGITPQEFTGQARQIRDLATGFGRDGAAIQMCMRFNIALDDEEVTETELRSTVKGGDTKRIIETAEIFAAAGATHFMYALNGHEPDVLRRTMESLARDLLPRFAS
jgi:probable F420-dependent oxidoreductase